jgi:hypothetical protein
VVADPSIIGGYSSEPKKSDRPMEEQIQAQCNVISAILTQIAQLMKLYSIKYLSAGERAQFEPFMRQALEIAEMLRIGDSPDPLNAILGPALTKTIPFFYNTWLKYIYLPLAQSYYEIFFSDELLKPMRHFIESNAKKPVPAVAEFLTLQNYFYQTNPVLDIQGIISAFLEVAARRQNCTKFFRRSFFSKLEELVGPDQINVYRYLIGHRTAIHFEKLKAALVKLYPMGIPVQYQAGNFDLRETTVSYIKLTAKWTAKQLKERFPGEPSRLQLGNQLFDCSPIIAQMRKDYRDALVEFQRSLEKAEQEEDDQVLEKFTDQQKRKLARDTAALEGGSGRLRRSATSTRRAATAKSETDLMQDYSRLHRLTTLLVQHVSFETKAIARIGEARKIATGVEMEPTEILQRFAMQRQTPAQLFREIEADWQKIISKV